MTRGVVHFADNLDVLRGTADGSVDLIYIDPPFNTGTDQVRRVVRVERCAAGEVGARAGFHGLKYRRSTDRETSFADSFDDYPAFLRPRLEEAMRVLAPAGSLYVHLDQREVHHVKVMMDALFGRERFLSEIIWAYDYGAKPRRRWAPKHDTILVYVKSAGRHFFNADEIDRIPYMTPELVGPEKAARGKLPTDVWWHTIVPTRSREKTGYPTQKPLGVLRRIVRASSPPGGLVMDFFAGSGTTGAACLELGRRFLLVDNHTEALSVMARRFADVPGIEWRGWPPPALSGRPAGQSAGA